MKLHFFMDNTEQVQINDQTYRTPLLIKKPRGLSSKFHALTSARYEHKKA